MLDHAIAAISDPTRRRILELLRQSDRSVGELVMELRMEQTNVSKHLRSLRLANLVVVHSAGRFRYYQLNPEPLEEVASWLRGFGHERERD
ncbi:MAG: metalloregulator ArsR/SmtB family transcription factor [Acidimicrobiia bacterium]